MINHVTTTMACLALVLAAVHPSLAADYAIDRYAVTGSGSPWCEGGPYELIGSAGQADVGTLSGDVYAMIGGFWSLICPYSSAPVDDPKCPPEGCEFDVCGTKGRYLSFHAGDPGELQAVRVTFVSLPGSEYAEGRTMWVQEPFLVTEASGSSDPLPPPTMWAATLDCTPFYTDWSIYDVVDVYDDGIVALGMYDVQLIHLGCGTADESAYSDAYSIRTSELGDVVGDRTAPPPMSPPQCVCDFNDISAIVDKFKNEPTAPRKARADIINSDISQPKPDQKVDFVDITCAVECFRGIPCLLPGPPATDPCAKSGTVLHRGAPALLEFGDPVTVDLQGSDSEIRPGGLVDVDVYASDLVDLRTFQVSLVVSGGQSGDLMIEDLRIDSDRFDYVFGSEDAVAAIDKVGNRLGATLMAGGVTKEGPVYLGTFALRATPSARGTFDVQLKLDDDASLLRDSEVAAVTLRPGHSASISVTNVVSLQRHSAGRVDE